MWKETSPNICQLKAVKEWLPDFYKMSEGNEIRKVLGEIWECDVESIWHARSLVNTRIDTHIAWVQGFKYDVQSLIKKLIEEGHSVPDV